MLEGKNSFAEIEEVKPKKRKKPFSFGKVEYDSLKKDIVDLNKKLNMIISKLNREEGITVDEWMNGSTPKVVEEGFMQTEPANSTKHKQVTIDNKVPATIHW